MKRLGLAIVIAYLSWMSAVGAAVLFSRAGTVGGSVVTPCAAGRLALTLCASTGSLAL